MEDREWKYIIGFDLKSLIPGLIGLIIFSVITILLYKSNSGAFIFTMIFSIVMLGINLYSLYNILFVKIYAAEDCFCHRTSPGKGNCYRYSEISKAWREPYGNAYYFKYRTPEGKIKKFLFYPYQSEEIYFLLEKINGPEENQYE